MNTLEQEYDYNRIWSLKAVQKLGWELIRVNKEMLKEPYYYATEVRKKPYLGKDGIEREYTEVLATGVKRYNITYLWKKSNAYCAHVKSFNPIAILE